jgi:GTPase SAR1 family protein
MEVRDSLASQMKFKIVFLGDQSVGKTSLILRFTQDTFDIKYMVNSCGASDLVGNDWNRLPKQDSDRERQNGEAAAVGHGRPGALPIADSLLH